MALLDTSAGGIVFRRRGHQVQVCLIRDRYGYWTFPKGHLEPGETPQQAALREVREEVGLAQVRIAAAVGTTEYRFPLGDDICNKTVHFFLMQAPPDAECAAALGQAIEDAGWFTPQQARSLIGYRNLRPLLRRALRMIQRQL